MGEQGLQLRSAWLPSPVLEPASTEGPPGAGCCAECSLFSELSKLLGLGLGELSVWRKTEHGDHRAGG